jgi:polar amino acid transport system substrate-binding protein
MKKLLRKLSVDRYPRNEKVMKATGMGEAVNIGNALHILLFSLLILTAAFVVSSQYAGAQAQRTPIPLVTLVPPTLLPPAPTATATPPLTQSALARIKSNNTLIVGFLYNVNLFALPTGTGSPDNPDIDGFEPDLAQAIADDWGVKLQPRQVTQLNARDMLLGGQIDLLMGQSVVSRDNQSLIDYSDPVFLSKDVALVNSDFTGKDIPDLAGQTVAVVTGSRAERAYKAWMQANGLQSTVNEYPMLDDALRALTSKQVAAVIGDRWELHARVSGVMQGVQLLPGVFQTEPYAIAMRRYDDNLRTLVDRTLQRLVESKRLDPIYDTNFPGDLLPASDRPTIRVWTGLDDDKRAIADFPTDVIMPTQPIIPRIKNGQPVRIAGLGAPLDATGKQPLLDGFNQAMINEMTRRWGIQAQIVPDSYGKGEDMVASGQADLAVGIEPHWGSVDRVDFVAIYAEHSYRIIIPAGTNAIKAFSDLFATNRQFGYFTDDPGALDAAKQQAQKSNIVVDSLKPIKLQTDEDALSHLNDRTANLIFGDSLRLYPLAQTYPKFVQLLDPQYGGGKQVAFAVPRNDADFRVLVEATLQDMARDGTYQKIWQSNFGIGTPLSVIVWPGSSTVFGIKTSG